MVRWQYESPVMPAGTTDTARLQFRFFPLDIVGQTTALCLLAGNFQTLPQQFRAQFGAIPSQHGHGHGPAVFHSIPIIEDQQLPPFIA